MTDSADHGALLEVHELERRAHLNGDAALLATAFADHVWEASRGQLTRLTRADIEERFRNYFASVRYKKVDGRWQMTGIASSVAERD